MYDTREAAVCWVIIALSAAAAIALMVVAFNLGGF
jgi:hypothetical protein